MGRKKAAEEEENGSNREDNLPIKNPTKKTHYTLLSTTWNWRP
jgi:hypothetical protein